MPDTEDPTAPSERYCSLTRRQASTVDTAFGIQAAKLCCMSPVRRAGGAPLPFVALGLEAFARARWNVRVAANRIETEATDQKYRGGNEKQIAQLAQYVTVRHG